MTARQFAAARGVTDTSLRYWATRLADADKAPEARLRRPPRSRVTARPVGAPALARVVRPGETPSAGGAGRIMVIVGKASVVVEAGFDDAHLRDVVRALGEVG